MRRRLVIMVRAPQAGRVKTRLARGIGVIPATWWYRHQVKQSLRRLSDPRWQVVLAVTPDRAKMASRFATVAQGSGDLGQRMKRLLSIYAPAPTVLVGSDIPGLEASHIWRAFRALRGHDAVLGPAKDGGFWLIGTRGVAVARALDLTGVRWSVSETLADTLGALYPLRCAKADELQDVDEISDLQRWQKKSPAGAGAFERAGSPTSRAGWGL